MNSLKELQQKWREGPITETDCRHCCADELSPFISREEKLVEALKPFADKEECDAVGCIVGYDDDHTAQCVECQRILSARKALAHED